MSQPIEPPATLSPKQQAFVAAYIGEAKHNATEAARLAGYAHPNKQGPALLVNLGIRAAIDAHLAEVKAQGIALQANRIEAAQNRHDRMNRVIIERETWFAEHDPAAPGGQSGLLVRRVKRVQHSYEPNPDEEETGEPIVLMQEQVEYEVDTGLLKELRELERQVAQELGQMVDRSEQTISGAGGAPLTVIIAERPDGPQ